MKKIALTQGLFALVDDEDFEWLNKHKWYAHKGRANKSPYAVRKSSRKDNNGKQKDIAMHRAIAIKHQLIQDYQMADHRDLNGLNNQKQNLRLASHGNNLHNRSVQKNNISGLKGVSPSGSNWRSRIGINGKYHCLGTFFSKEQAHEAYKKKALELYKEFARV